MSKMMRKMMMGAAAMAAMLPMAAQAGSQEGKIQVKVMATGVLPNGKLSSVYSNALGVSATTDVRANNNTVPTLAVEYFFNKNISVETICCFTTHNVDAISGSVGLVPLAGRGILENVMILPATVTAKYHLPLGPVKPYVGAGPSLFVFLKNRPGEGAAALGATSSSMPAQLGFALQAGVDIPVTDSGLSLSIDAKRYFMRPKATLYAGGTEVLSVRSKLDPWVLSAGAAYRF